ncbi:hypothetical protein BSU00_04485 [Tenacibaculum sp. SG-28]|nr:hypothetical protein BSU00_04485 [Tenacibaculum sp. SG-28]
MGFFIGFLVKLFFLKSKYNIYETLILVFFTVGIGNLIFVAFGVFETITSLEIGNIAYLFAMLYSAWAIGNFFDKFKAWSYIKGFLAYFLGTSIGSFLIVIIGVLVEIINRKM